MIRRSRAQLSVKHAAMTAPWAFLSTMISAPSLQERDRPVHSRDASLRESVSKRWIQAICVQGGAWLYRRRCHRLRTPKTRLRNASTTGRKDWKRCLLFSGRSFFVFLSCSFVEFLHSSLLLVTFSHANLVKDQGHDCTLSDVLQAVQSRRLKCIDQTERQLPLIQ